MEHTKSAESTIRVCSVVQHTHILSLLRVLDLKGIRSLHTLGLFQQRSTLKLQASYPSTMPLQVQSKRDVFGTGDFSGFINALYRASNYGIFRTKLRIVLHLAGGAHVQDMAVIQVERHVPDHGPFFNGCKVLCRAFKDSGSAASTLA